MVMYAGRIVEQGPCRAILHEPLHPYTRALLGCALPEEAASLPSDPQVFVSYHRRRTGPANHGLLAHCDFESRCPDRMRICAMEVPKEFEDGERTYRVLLQVREFLMSSAGKSEPLVRITDLRKTYSRGRWWEKQFHLRALDGVDLTLERGKDAGGCRRIWIGQDHIGDVRGSSGQARLRQDLVRRMRSFVSAQEQGRACSVRACRWFFRSPLLRSLRISPQRK